MASKNVKEATCADNTALVVMNEDSILHNLEMRHKNEDIYTYTASVLLAVNPYKRITNLYGDAQCALYRGKHIGALPPHPYAIADTAYRMLVREKANQALLISGESGAGKTETAKIVMQYLAFASGSASDLTTKIQERVLQAQPILESLGNASTLRNSNSSRFGKYNQVYFDADGALVDAGIQTYLLESSRVVVHGERERTYHIFYEMLQGLSEDKMKAYNLDKKKHYHIMHQNPSALVEGFEEGDKTNFGRFCEALKTVGQDQDSIDGILQVLAGLLHLSDIPKQDAEVEMAAWSTQDDDEETDGRTVEVNDDSISHAAELLGMDPDELCGTLKRRRITIPGRDSIHEVARNPVQFRGALHSLIKAIYKRLFEQTVSRINDSFRELRPVQPSAEEAWKSIGILDIYGFERLKQNSFEQLCINLANERLQQYFVENFLVAEQQLYKREGLPWTGVNLPDSTPVVNCISQVFKTLDDFSSRSAKGFGKTQQCSDDHFCEKVLKESAAHAERKEILKPFKISAKDARSRAGAPRANEVFVITHYAGTVDYNTNGWLDKNNDRLLPECEALVAQSTYPPMKALADEDAKEKTAFRSISSKYSKDLEALLTTLGESNLHYIRCFKPNALQKPAEFDHPLVLEQIVQCGTVELVKIMHDGFPNRCDFESLYTRFKSLLPEQFSRYGRRTFIEALMLAYEVPRSQWALGMSRLFLKAGQLKALEDMREGGAMPDPVVLEGIVKQIVRKRWIKACSAIRLCIYMPKLMRQVRAQRAFTGLSAIANVTSRIAPRLEAARQRIQERRLAARRRLGGAFRAVYWLSRSMRHIKEQRRQRVVKAFSLATFILARMKPRIASARQYMQEAEVRRQRDEERARQEMEKRVKEEAERMVLEAEKRRQEEQEAAEKQRQEEEEQHRVQKQQEEEAAEKRRQEEEVERARRDAERAAEEERLRIEQEQLKEQQRLEGERLREEEQRKFEEEKRKMMEDMAEEMKAEKQRMAEQMAEKLQEERRKAEEEMAKQRSENERLMEERFKKQQEEIDQLKEMTQRRLSSAPQSTANLSITSWTQNESMPGLMRVASDDDGSTVDISDSVSQINASGTSALQQQVQQTVQAEISRLLESRSLADAARVKELTEKNLALERKLQEHHEDVEDKMSDIGDIDLSFPANGTPPRDMTPKPKKNRNSVATDALRQQLSMSATRTPGQLSSAGKSTNLRSYWAEQRSFLTEDLGYSLGN